MAFANSVCSYPDRGHYGNARYRGNCSGYVIKDFLESFHRKKDGLFCDPAIGGNTSMDVAKEMGIRFVGTDLSKGVDLLVDDLSSIIGEEVHTAFFHPPYGPMLTYSNNMWGDEPHPHDMSRLSIPDFTEALALSVMNIHDCVENGGHYGILMGNLRQKGKYYNFSSLVERVAPGVLQDEIIKLQANCWSDKQHYKNSNLIRIKHEKLMVFQKGKAGALIFLSKTLNRANNMVQTTWRVAIRRVLQGKPSMSLKDIYSAVEPFANTRDNKHWQEKVRQVLQDARYFVRVERGVFRLAC